MRRPGATVVAVGALAFVCRLYPVLHGGGLKGIAGYDDGVYYSAADAVIAGRVPYRDFVLLHPPGLVYLLTPFAALGHLIGDANGWVLARLAMMAVGATSAMLVVVVAGRFGPVAGVGGGLLYAVWPPAINGESSTLLECVPNLLLLTALLLLGSPRLSLRPRWVFLAGAALGLAMSIKIWGVAPLVIVTVWQLLTAGWRRIAALLAGAAVAALVVCLPTFVIDPARMYLLVVSDQLQRNGVHTSLLVRLADFTPVHRLLPHASTATELALVVAVGAIGLAAAALAWRVPRARIFVALLVGQGAVLCASPPYFTHYGAFLAPAVTLTAGVGGQELVDLVTDHAPDWRRPVVAALSALVAVVALPVLTTRLFTPYDGARIAALVANRRCVVADSPGALVLADLLTRDLQRGCPTRIDVSGATYNSDALLGPGGHPVPRVRDPLWQNDIMRYLASAGAAVVTRSAADGFDRRSLAVLHRMPLIYRGRDVTVYDTRPSPSSPSACQDGSSCPRFP